MIAEISARLLTLDQLKQADGSEPICNMGRRGDWVEEVSGSYVATHTTLSCHHTAILRCRTNSVSSVVVKRRVESQHLKFCSMVVGMFGHIGAQDVHIKIRGSQSNYRVRHRHLSSLAATLQGWRGSPQEIDRLVECITIKGQAKDRLKVLLTKT